MITICIGIWAVAILGSAIIFFIQTADYNPYKLTNCQRAELRDKQWAEWRAENKRLRTKP